MGEPGYLLIVLIPMWFAVLTYLGDGSPWQALVKIFGSLKYGIDGLWFLFTAPVRRQRQPLQADAARISELEHWNRTWSHPEIGDFYVWQNQSYIEASQIAKRPEYQAESYDYTPGPGRVWSVPKGATLGSWCRSCKSPAHGAEYCRRCVDNYGYREGKKRYKLSNGRYVDTYEETICEVCEEPLPLYWSRICSAECGQKQRDRCKDTMCGGYGTVYRGGRCKGCYEVRERQTRDPGTRRLFENADTETRRGVQGALDVTPDGIWGPATEYAIARYRDFYGDDDIVRALRYGDRRCSWCGATEVELWGDHERWYCNRQCRLLYRTEP